MQQNPNLIQFACYSYIINFLLENISKFSDLQQEIVADQVRLEISTLIFEHFRSKNLSMKDGYTKIVENVESEIEDSLVISNINDFLKLKIDLIVKYSKPEFKESVLAFIRNEEAKL